MLYVALERKRLFAIFLVIVLSVLIFAEFSGETNNPENARTNYDRVCFLEKNGFSVCEDLIETKETVLPLNLSDFKEYGGCKVKIYTYYSECGNYRIMIYAYRDRVIGYKWKSKDLINL